MNRVRIPIPSDSGEFLTGDLYVSAFLVARGHIATEISQTEIKKFCFRFDASEKLQADCAAFATNEPIGICEYLRSLYFLKSELRRLGERR